MKKILLIVIIFLLSTIIRFGYAEETKEVHAYDWKLHQELIDKQFEEYAQQVLKAERQKVESLLTKDKADKYMKSFEEGMCSPVGMIMIEGGENRWLEIAYQSGYQQKVLFRQGYFKGLVKAAESSEVTKPLLTTKSQNIEEEIVESWGRQKDFFRDNNFIIIDWEVVKKILIQRKIKGGKQYHTGWLTIYTLDEEKFLTKQPQMDALWKFMEEQNLNLEGFGTE